MVLIISKCYTTYLFIVRIIDFILLPTGKKAPEVPFTDIFQVSRAVPRSLVWTNKSTSFCKPAPHPNFCHWLCHDPFFPRLKSWNQFYSFSQPFTLHNPFKVLSTLVCIVSQSRIAFSASQPWHSSRPSLLLPWSAVYPCSAVSPLVHPVNLCQTNLSKVQP